MTDHQRSISDTLVSEVSFKRAHELDRPQGESSGDLSPADRLSVPAGTVQSLGLGFHLGAAIERIALAADQGSTGIPRLREAAWLIERYVTLLETRPIGADIHAATYRLVHSGGMIATDAQELASELESSPALGGAPGPASSAKQTVRELPSVRRELLVTVIRAGITVAAIVATVLVLTLIAQWR